MPTCRDCSGRGKREYGVIDRKGDLVSDYAADSFTVEMRECPACGGTGRWRGRRDLFQDGERIGTLPQDFSPDDIKSISFWYEPRPGDFRRDGEAWIARQNLGPGDLEAVPGFVWSRNER